jgi:DNA-binding transcriptional LysR family regulator
MIDLSSLRSLIAVRDHGSVVGAAEALGYTPSAVSQQIKRLEQQSRAPMLERVGRGVILTDKGRLLAERGARLLADFEEVANLALDGSGELRGTLRVASFSTASRGLVAPLLARLARTAPGVDLTVTEHDPREIVTLVERGGADFGIVHDWTSVPLDIAATVVREHLLTDAADVLLHRDHPLVGAVSVQALDLVDERWVSTPVGSICHEWLHQMFGMHGARPDIRYYDGSFATHVALVEQGVAVALLPRLGRERLPSGVRAVPVNDPAPRRNVSAIWRRASADSPVRLRVQSELEAMVAERAGSAG